MSCKNVEKCRPSLETNELSMCPKVYQSQVAATETTLTPPEYNTELWRIQHGVIGIVTEAGELLDALKRYLYYKRQLDKTNLVEELGDVMWYVALVCNAIGVQLGDVMSKNIKKLRARYENKFSPEAAMERDLEKERKVLEAQETKLRDTVAEMENEELDQLAQEYLDDLQKRVMESMQEVDDMAMFLPKMNQETDDID